MPDRPPFMDGGGIINTAFEDIELEDKSNYNNDANGDVKKSELESVVVDSSWDSTNEDSINLVPFYKLFKFATKWDLFLVLIAIVAAVIGGLSFPFMIILFGDLADTFISYDIGTEVCELSDGRCCRSNGTTNAPTCDLNLESLTHSVGPQDFFSGITRFGQGTSLIGLINLIMAYVFVTTLNYTAERQVYKIRNAFFSSILKQDIGWFDTHETGDFASKITEDLNKLQEGIGEKIGLFVFFITIFGSSLINAFIHGWELTLVILAAMPILIVAVGIISKSQTALTVKEANAYNKAGAIVEEALSAIKTVVAFQGQSKEVKRYKDNLVEAERAGMMRGLLTGIGGGLMWFIIYSSYAIAFWYGVKLIMDDREACFNDFKYCRVRYSPSSLLIVFLSVLMGAMNVGQASPYVEAFAMARGAANSIFQIIDKIPRINKRRNSFKSIDDKIEFQGKIALRNVKFSYPSRPGVPVLNGISFEVSPGQTVALVGPSGCGKSTIIQLVQRFYDPLSGAIEFDGKDIKCRRPDWIRSKLGVVGQEPVLFECSIKENICLGIEDQISDEDMDEACKAANAFDFIQKLPKKYETIVGEKGAQLSGGQKQRIAIARALIRKPSVLLLDEASSALDTQSESVVQSALDKARNGRTTIVVAHRLSTIKSADVIIVIKDGCKVQSGTHESLLNDKSGLYLSLVQAQEFTTKENISAPIFNPELDLEEEDEIHDLERVENELNSMTFGSLNSWNRRQQFIKPTLERRHSTGSTYSEDSMTIEDAFDAAGSAIGIARVGSRKIRRTSANMENEIIGKEEEGEDLNMNEVGFFAVLKENSQEWGFILIGCAASIIMGASMPVYAYLFGEVLGVLSLPIEIARSNSVHYSMLFLIVGVVVGFSMFLQICMFSFAGEKLTTKLRIKAFSAMLKQEIGWYDEPTNNTGSLCARLSADASAIQGATGSRLGTIIQVVFTLVISISAALYLNFKLGAVGSLFVPFVLIGAWFQGKIISSQDSLEREGLSKSAKFAVEAINGIRTVVGLRLEAAFEKRYSRELESSHISAKRKSHLRGLIFGFAQSVPFFAYAGCLYYGGILVSKEELPYKDVFKVAETLILGTLMVGQATAFAPNYTKAKIASARIFKLLQRKPLIDADIELSENQREKSFNGNVDFVGAGFSYPTRKSVKVFRDLKLSIKAGQNVAIVGPSGCGKSTIIQLIQRFYNLNSGKMEFDFQDSMGVNAAWIRSKLGIVSQEPNLFDRSIAENIRYGNNSTDTSMDDVIQAAMDSNIHSFIANLPQGYETRVGSGGTQLSGGQKQRLAIARALLRNPSLLLLDEATSALDTESEKVVQEALSKAQENRTSITIAHRISTIKNSDKIFVLNHGKIAESGTHESLLQSKGLYFKLWSN